MKITCGTQMLNNGKEIKIYTLQNKNGMSVQVLNLGGIITKILVPDRDGKLENIILEYKDLNTYITNPGYLGAIIGPTAGRIHKGQVHIGNMCYSFPENNNGNTLHGGDTGFDKKIWDSKIIEDQGEESLILYYTSKDGEDGYPGEVKISVSYTLTEDNKLILTYRGNTDKDTLLNLTNHAYFNLSGEAKRDILNQKLYINSDKILEADHELIPTGNLLDVEDHIPFNFKKAKCIGDHIDEEHIQLKNGGGYDHVWLLNDGKEGIQLVDETSGRCMTITTDQKAVVIYTQNFPGEGKLSNGENAKKRYACCFETQGLPIGYNEAFKESSILKKEDAYYQQTCFAFTIK